VSAVARQESRRTLLELLEELGAIQGVRGALIATSGGAFADGQHSSLAPRKAKEVAKTVRRMVVASSTVGAPLEELLVNFGPARMMVLPLHDDATLIVLIERDTAIESVRRLLAVQRRVLSELLTDLDAPDAAPAGGGDDIDRLLAGELGPVLREISMRYTSVLRRGGMALEQADLAMREQLREWLLCCNPSPYTFPLLLDGLSQGLNDQPEERARFLAEVQQLVQTSQVMASGRGGR
jgi:predicted regulator of Ras-like GTPase activity (Roadblock/LC7/MglB family)